MSAAAVIYVPHDSLAVALGADAIAAALAAKGAKVIRTGSRGMHWLEPLVEIECEGVRQGFGPVDLDDIESLIAAIAPYATPWTAAPSPVRTTLWTASGPGAPSPWSRASYLPLPTATSGADSPCARCRPPATTRYPVAPRRRSGPS